MKKLKILLLALAATISLGAWAETDYTKMMSADWINSTGNFGDGRECYKTANYTAGQKVMYQSITAPATGIYEIKFYAVTSSTSGRGFENIYGDNIAVAYASTSNENTVTIPMTVINQTGCTLAEPGNIRTLSIEAAEGETIEYGLKNIAEGGNWYTIQGISIKMKTVAEIYQPVYDEALKIYDNSDESVTGAKAEFFPYIEAMETALNGTLAEAKTAADNLAAAQAIYMSKSTPQRNSGVKYDFTSKMNMAINAWTCAQGNGPAQYGFTGATETYNSGGPFATGKVMYQTITGLANGEYKVQFYGVANSANGVSSVSGTGYAQAYANSISQDIEVIAQNGCTPSDFSRTITCTVTDGTLEFGLKNIAEGGNWYLCKAVALYMTGGPNLDDYRSAIANNLVAANSIQSSGLKMQTEVKTALDDAITNAASYETETVISVLETMNQNLSNAIAAANKSIADYANLKAAIDLAKKYTVIDETYETLATTITTAEGIYNNGTVETCAETIAGLDEAVKAAKVADYTYVSNKYLYSVNLGTWNETDGVSEFSTEHWSGETHSYKNQDDSNGRGYNSSTGFSIGLNKDVKLPEGKYVFKACGRKSDLATLELIVKVKDGDELGRVSDFPSSNNAKGIDKNGVTSFEGDNFAHDGNGFGWQWRFVEFELNEETTINVAVSASATRIHQWVSFGDYSVLTNSENNIPMIAYNIALNDANLAIANDKYKTVTGAEKTKLTDAINATPGSTKDEIEAATTALKTATENFVNAAPAYDNYVAILAKVENLDEAGKAKFAELTAEIKTKYENHTVTAEELTDATDYFNQAFNVQNPNKDVTYLLKNPSFEETTDVWNNGWTTVRNTTGDFDYRTDTANPADGTYTLNAWAYKVNYINVYQKVILPKGAYKLSAKARTDKEPLENQTQVRTYIGGVLKSESQGLTYTPTQEYAWNSKEAWQTLTTIFYIDEPTEVEMGIYSKGKNEDNNQQGWFQVDDFRLVYLGDATANMTITDANWGTFCAPFDVTIPEGVKAYTAEAEGNPVTFTEVTTTIPAGTPVVVYSAAAVNKDFNSKATTTGETCTSGALVGVYAATSGITAETGHTNYVLQNNAQGVGFYKVAENETISLNANRCYMTLATSAGAKDCVVLDGIVTGINEILNPTKKSVEGIFDLNGRKLAAPQKGINIINGVKVIVK